jgi:hypothetical protein
MGTKRNNNPQTDGFRKKKFKENIGPTYENGFWRIKTNHKLDKIIKHENIINFARAQRLG